MINVLGENYYIDLDVVEKYLDMSNDTSPEALSGTTEMKINVIKFEMVKMFLVAAGDADHLRIAYTVNPLTF
jgi:hypothetical protein